MIFILFLQIFFFVGILSASPDFLTLQSKITQPNGQNLEAASVNFRITITDPVGTCIVYQEDFSSVNMTSSKGLVAIKVGSGTRSYPVAATTMKDIFKNFNSPVFTCQAGGNYTAAAADQRKLVMQFNDGSGWQTVPSMEINSTPFSLESLTAQKLGTFPAADYVRAAQFASCGGSEAVHFNGTNFTCVSLSSGAASSVAAGAGTVAAPSISFSGDTNTGFYSGAADAISLTNNGVNTFNVTTTAITSTTTGGAAIGQAAGAAATPTFSFAGDADTGWYRAAADTLAASTGGAERIRIDSSGKVGIGTTTPSDRLSVTQSISNASGNASLISMTHSQTVAVGDSSSALRATNTVTGTSLLNLIAGGNFSITTSNSSGANNVNGVLATTAHSAGITGRVDGLRSDTAIGGTVFDASGLKSTVTNFGGTITRGYGGVFDYANAAGTVGNAYGVHSSISAAGGTVTNGYGLYVGNVVATSKWSLYASDATAPSYFAGNVGIGTTSPDSKLQVDGHIWPETTATSDLGSGALRWNNIYLSNAPDVVSDARLKKNVKTSDLGLDFINSLRPVFWTWKDQNQGTSQHYGVIAQEMERAVRKAKGYTTSNVIVSHNDETDSYSVRYTELISPIIKAVQELYNDLLGIKAVNNVQDRQIASKADQAELKAIKSESDFKIKKLESENSDLKAWLQRQERELAAIKRKLGL